MFKLKLAHELKTGDKILFARLETNKLNEKRLDYYDVTNIGYIQCNGLVHIKYGEYGYLYLNDEKQTKVLTYKDAPFIVHE